VTTMVEPEHPPRRPRGVRLILVAVAAVAATVLVIAGAVSLARGDRPGVSTATSDPAHGSFVSDASFVLQNYGTLPAEAAQLWQDLTLDQVVSLGLPFSRYNRYYTRFFVKEGETVEILLEANVPMGTSLEGGLEGISVMLIPGSAPYEQAHAFAYLPPTEKSNGGYFTRLVRSGGKWTVSWAMTALSSDYYWLILTNTARQDAWCHFTVNVPTG
jgi:hypothetical protein